MQAHCFLQPPRCSRNVSRRRVCMGPAMVKVNVRGGATRAMRKVIAFAVHSVTCAGFGRAVAVGGALWPNPAVERTCREALQLGERRGGAPLNLCVRRQAR